MGFVHKRGFIYLGKKRRNPGRYIYSVLVIAVVIGTVWAYLGQGPSRSPSVTSKKTTFVPVTPTQAAKPKPAPVEAGHKVMLTVSRDETFMGILQENGVPKDQALEIMERSKAAFDLSKLTTGNELTLLFSKDRKTFLGLEYEIAGLSRLVVCIDGGHISARTQRIDRIVKSSSADTLRQVDLIVKRGDNIYGLLQACGIGFSQIRSLFTSARHEYNLADIVPGHPLKVWVTGESPKRLEKLTYEIDPVTYLEVLPKDGLFKARTRTRAIETSFERAQGTISNSLYESAVRSGLSPEIVMDLSDIFGWDINFFTDIKDGDTFTVLYEKNYVRDQFKGYGKVLAARFVVQGEEHLAVYFDNGKGIHGYFDEHGKPIRKLFLKAPLNYRRISSGFSYHRIHPIFHIRRPHLGVDYAAPMGTPVVALGEGRITSYGRSGGFGNAVTINHPLGYVTHYGHLCRFARGITVGKRVCQGDVIGYVGMTGIATGPHLDFRVQYRGKYTNPLHLEPVNGPPLRGSILAKFKRVSLKELALLDDRTIDKSSFKMSKSG
ncbi:MAG TPA: M23 family metallopeptidase [Desulfomonilia bacterium]|nr:M23 family metallopeptidase [Desulfomonilia bacterium]